VGSDKRMTELRHSCPKPKSQPTKVPFRTAGHKGHLHTAPLGDRLGTARAPCKDRNRRLVRIMEVPKAARSRSEPVNTG